MENKERKIAVVTRLVFVPIGSEHPCAFKIARVVDGKLIEDETPRAYPPRSPYCEFKVGNVLTLTDNDEVEDILSFLEQPASINRIKELRTAILKKVTTITDKDELDRYARVVKGLSECVSYVDSFNKKPDPVIRWISGGPTPQDDVPTYSKVR